MQQTMDRVQLKKKTKRKKLLRKARSAGKSKSRSVSRSKSNPLSRKSVSRKSASRKSPRKHQTIEVVSRPIRGTRNPGLGNKQSLINGFTPESTVSQNVVDIIIKNSPPKQNTISKSSNVETRNPDVFNQARLSNYSNKVVDAFS